MIKNVLGIWFKIEHDSVFLSFCSYKQPMFCKHNVYNYVFMLNYGLTGIILVHDLTNKKSSQNLDRWSMEALNKDSSPTGVIVSNGWVSY